MAEEKPARTLYSLLTTLAISLSVLCVILSHTHSTSFIFKDSHQMDQDIELLSTPARESSLGLNMGHGIPSRQLVALHRLQGRLAKDVSGERRTAVERAVALAAERMTITAERLAKQAYVDRNAARAAELAAAKAASMISKSHKQTISHPKHKSHSHLAVIHPPAHALHPKPYPSAHTVHPKQVRTAPPPSSRALRRAAEIRRALRELAEQGQAEPCQPCYGGADCVAGCVKAVKPQPAPQLSSAALAAANAKAQFSSATQRSIVHAASVAKMTRRPKKVAIASSPATANSAGLSDSQQAFSAPARASSVAAAVSPVPHALTATHTTIAAQPATVVSPVAANLPVAAKSLALTHTKLSDARPPAHHASKLVAVAPAEAAAAATLAAADAAQAEHSFARALQSKTAPEQPPVQPPTRPAVALWGSQASDVPAAAMGIGDDAAAGLPYAFPRGAVAAAGVAGSTVAAGEAARKGWSAEEGGRDRPLERLQKRAAGDVLDAALLVTDQANGGPGSLTDSDLSILRAAIATATGLSMEHVSLGYVTPIAGGGGAVEAGCRLLVPPSAGRGACTALAQRLMHGEEDGIPAGTLRGTGTARLAEDEERGEEEEDWPAGVEEGQGGALSLTPYVAELGRTDLRVEVLGVAGCSGPDQEGPVVLPDVPAEAPLRPADSSWPVPAAPSPQPPSPAQHPATAGLAASMPPPAALAAAALAAARGRGEPGAWAGHLLVRLGGLRGRGGAQAFGPRAGPAAGLAAARMEAERAQAEMEAAERAEALREAAAGGREVLLRSRELAAPRRPSALVQRLRGGGRAAAEALAARELAAAAAQGVLPPAEGAAAAEGL